MAAAAAEADNLEYGDEEYAEAPAGAGEEAANGGEEGADGAAADDELAEMQQIMDDLESSNNNLTAASAQAAEAAATSTAAKAGLEGLARDRDERSVFVGNVDFSATAADLSDNFSACGVVERVTVLTGRDGHPKGFAYIEFKDTDAVANALILDGTEFKGRQIKVTQKRTNVPMSHLRGRGRGAPRGGGPYRGGGRGFSRGRGGFRGSLRGGYRGGGGFVPRGGRARGRGRGGFATE